MMRRIFTPNRAIALTGLSPLLYWFIAPFFDPQTARDVLNPMATGFAAMISFTWLPSLIHSIRNRIPGWSLILGIFVVWTVVWMNRIYAAVFNYLGQPRWWLDSYLAGFWPWSYVVAGALFLYAAADDEEAISWSSSVTLAFAAAIAIGVGFAIIVIFTGIKF